MTQVNETSRPARTPRRPSAKPHGQWKVDGTAPLNHNEEFKQQDDGLNVRERIEQVYAHEGFDSIPSDDLHGRFRWWGLYTQRRQGIDGGKTATLEPHELEDRYFMLRVRIDGGDLTTEQLRVIGGISTDFGRDTADITDRQKAMLDFAMTVAVEAYRIGDAEIDALRSHGFSEEDIWDISAIAAFFAMSNRLANVTSMRPNDEFYMLGRT